MYNIVFYKKRVVEKSATEVHYSNELLKVKIYY